MTSRRVIFSAIIVCGSVAVAAVAFRRGLSDDSRPREEEGVVCLVGLPSQKTRASGDDEDKQMDVERDVRLIQDGLRHVRSGVALQTVPELCYALCSAERDSRKLDGGLCFATLSPHLLRYLQDGFLGARRPPSGAAPSASTSNRKTLGRDDPNILLFTHLLWAHRGLHTLLAESAVPFDDYDVSHVNLLQQLWAASWPPTATRPGSTAGGEEDQGEGEEQVQDDAASFQRTSPQWQKIGFQGSDPTTDIRAGGILSLKALVHFAQTHPAAWADMQSSVPRNPTSSYYPAITCFEIVVRLLTAIQKPVKAFGDPVTDRLPGLRFRHFEMLYDGYRKRYLTGSPKHNSPVGVHTPTTAEGDGDAAAAADEAKPKWWVSSLPDSTQEDGGAAVYEAIKESMREDGFYVLHHSLFLYFHECWLRDRPPLEQYNQFMSNVLTSYFRA